jgi:hypothetical protein
MSIISVPALEIISDDVSLGSSRSHLSILRTNGSPFSPLHTYLDTPTSMNTLSAILQVLRPPLTKLCWLASTMCLPG